MEGNKYAIGIDLGGSSVKFGLVSSDGKVKKKFKLDAYADHGPDAVVEQIKKGIEKLVNMDCEIAGIGIGAPGSVSIKGGIVENPPNMKNWERVELGKIIKKAFKMKVVVDNDANAAAIGEMIFGSGKKLSSFVMVTIGTGVGGGIIINRKIFKGESGAAGEIGHVTIDINGPKCKCGSRGCIETYVGRKYLADSAMKDLHRHKESVLHDLLSDGRELTPKIIYDAYKQGDAFAESVIVDAGKKLGYALASISNTLDISTYIIGGGISGFGKVLFKAIEEGMQERVVKPKRTRVKVLAAKLKNDAGIKGASALVFC